MKLKYKGIRIIIRLVDYENFKHADFKYGNNIIIYFHKSLSYKNRSDLLHKILKKARG